jgi:hypothetical protein
MFPILRFAIAYTPQPLAGKPSVDSMVSRHCFHTFPNTPGWFEKVEKKCVGMMKVMCAECTWELISARRRRRVKKPQTKLAEDAEGSAMAGAAPSKGKRGTTRDPIRR